MSQNLGLGTSYQLHMIHNVRPAMELSGPTRWFALTMTSFGVLIASAALLIFVFGT
jgi:hypothetical protein